MVTFNLCTSTSARIVFKSLSPVPIVPAASLFVQLEGAEVCSDSHAHHPTGDVCRNDEQVSLTVEIPTCLISSTCFSDHEVLSNTCCPYVFKSIFQVSGGSTPLFLAEWKLDSLRWGEGL